MLRPFLKELSTLQVEDLTGIFLLSNELTAILGWLWSLSFSYFIFSLCFSRILFSPGNKSSYDLTSLIILTGALFLGSVKDGKFKSGFHLMLKALYEVFFFIK